MSPNVKQCNIAEKKALKTFFYSDIFIKLPIVKKIDVLCECNIAEIILKLKATKRLKKLSLLSNEQLAKIKGGVVEDFGGISLLGDDINTQRKCRCTGLGNNDNQASECYCSDAGCSRY